MAAACGRRAQLAPELTAGVRVRPGETFAQFFRKVVGSCLHLNIRLACGAVVEARIFEDLMSFGTTPLARGQVMDGSFIVLLPEKLEPELLNESPVSCGDSHPIAFVPYLSVVEDEAAIGQLWRTSEEPGDWGMAGPSSFTYLAYVEEGYAAEDDCWGGVIALDLQPGWNLYSRIVTETGSLTTSAEPPEEFVWTLLR